MVPPAQAPAMQALKRALRAEAQERLVAEQEQKKGGPKWYKQWDYHGIVMADMRYFQPSYFMGTSWGDIMGYSYGDIFWAIANSDLEGYFTRKHVEFCFCFSKGSYSPQNRLNYSNCGISQLGDLPCYLFLQMCKGYYMLLLLFQEGGNIYLALYVSCSLRQTCK